MRITNTAQLQNSTNCKDRLEQVYPLCFKLPVILKIVQQSNFDCDSLFNLANFIGNFYFLKQFVISTFSIKYISDSFHANMCGMLLNIYLLINLITSMRVQLLNLRFERNYLLKLMFIQK